jgi:hypothetical protein
MGSLSAFKAWRLLTVGENPFITQIGPIVLFRILDMKELNTMADQVGTA